MQTSIIVEAPKKLDLNDSSAEKTHNTGEIMSENPVKQSTVVQTGTKTATGQTEKISGQSVQVMPTGFDPAKNLGRTSDIIAMVDDGGECLIPTIFIAKEGAKIDSSVFFNVYSMDADTLKQGRFEDCTFTKQNIVKRPTRLADSKKGRMQQVLAGYKDRTMTVRPDCKGKNSVALESGKVGINRINLKQYNALVINFKEGVREDGSPWGLLSVIDASLAGKPISTIVHSVMAIGGALDVWVQPTHVRKLGAGPESIVSILGVPRYNWKMKKTQMTASSIIPIMIAPNSIIPCEEECKCGIGASNKLCPKHGDFKEGAGY